MPRVIGGLLTGGVFTYFLTKKKEEKLDDIVIEELNFMKTIYKAIGLPSETIEQIVQDYS